MSSSTWLYNELLVEVKYFTWRICRQTVTRQAEYVRERHGREQRCAWLLATPLANLAPKVAKPIGSGLQRWELGPGPLIQMVRKQNDVASLNLRRAPKTRFSSTLHGPYEHGHRVMSFARVSNTMFPHPSNVATPAKPSDSKALRGTFILTTRPGPPIMARRNAKSRGIFGSKGSTS